VIVRFVAGTFVAIAIAVIGGYFVLRAVAIDEAKRQTRASVRAEANLVGATVRDGLLQGRARAVRRVDDTVVARVLSDSIVRVKIWSPGGRVLYSDEPKEIGGRFALSPEQHRLLRDGGAQVEVTDLNRPENALDRRQGKLLEAYTRIRTPSGTPLLFEIYQPLRSVTADARRLLAALAPPILGAIALILLIQVPLFWSLMRRLQLSHEQREGLLANAVTSSRRERRRVASYLHDGPVQELAGLAFSLAPVADDAASRGDERDATVVRTVIDRLRGTVRDLRALLVDLHPPILAAAGLDAALGDLASPLSARGTRVELRVEGGGRAARSGDAGARLSRRPGGLAQRDRVCRRLRGLGRGRCRGLDGAPPRRRRRARLRAGDAGAAARRGARRSLARRGAGPAGGREPHDRLPRGRGHTRAAGGAAAVIRVLIADDHGVVRDGLAGVIDAQPDLEVVAAVENGAEAVESCRRMEPDVVLMDLEMPVLDGIDATRAIRKERPGTAVLVLTSFSDARRITAALDVGAAGYLLKDTSAEDVVRGIRAAAEGGAPLDPQAARLLLEARDAPDPLEGISPREREVFALLLDGLPNKLIAQRLGISEKTVKTHLTNIFRQIGVTDRLQAVLWAERQGLRPDLSS
jgi:DNA-binding NarL/FixJ family response regulator/signal transduction histidine kinase